MRTQLLWGFAAALCLAACGKEAPVEETPVEAPVAEPTPVVESIPTRPEFDQAFIDHMHVHADQMDELMFALEDGDLQTASSHAAWLSRHHAEDRIPDEWLPYLEAMRESARAVENATSLGAARDAAEKISVHCQECHAAARIAAGG